MNIPEINRTYLARDVYRAWKGRVSKAEESITVYSPFFDRLLLSLLGNAGIDNEDISIITDLNPASILEMPNQLLTIKRALSIGISVSTISRLHAKVLLIDDKFISTGSQNFTSYGRKSKECTVVPYSPLENTQFVTTLISWRDNASPIDEELIDVLISKLSRRISLHKKLIEETQVEFDQILEEYEQEKQNALIRRLEELERNSRIQLSHGVIYASIEHIYGGWDDYDSLVADYNFDMTRWVIKKDDGTNDPYRLNRLSMYPMIIAENNRMGFARIGKTRISYIRKSVNWTGRKLEVADMCLSVSIIFPEAETKKRNIIAIFKHSYLGSCEASFLFTGDALNLIRKKYLRGNSNWSGEHKSFIDSLEKNFFGSPRELNKFFSRFFANFTYSTLGRDNKNVREYLTGSRFRLSVIQFEGNPFLVIKTIR